jgi:hypothetical protein
MTTTEFGLTFGQILALLTILGGIVGTYVNVNVRVKAIEVEIENVKCQRAEDIKSIELNRKENREEHTMIIEKLDDMITNQHTIIRRQSRKTT